MPSSSPPLLIGSSAPARAFAEELQRVAPTDATVLFTGESGAGKGVAARALHAAGPRASGPFVVCHLAAISPSTIESALFGHERGAFTDARRMRRGYFRRAEGGTIVLDDVDLLPRDVQPKLLRVLQERVVEPLGSEQSVEVDVRVVATTSRDLRSDVEEGRFRRDLYYRLAVVTLAVPPLRVRADDLPALVEHFVERHAGRLGVPERPFSEAALERLVEHAWPGNVRELENAVERVLVLGHAGPEAGGEVRPVEPAELDFLSEPARGVAHELAARALGHGVTLDELTRALLEAALEENRGNVSAAARRVGVTRRAFDYRLSHGGSRRGSDDAG